MQGGAPKIIPNYVQPADAFKINMPKEQKEIYGDKIKSKMPPREIQPTISFQYNQPPPPPKKKEFVGDRVIDPSSFMTYVKPDLATYLQNQQYPNPYGTFAAQGFVPPVIVKNYAINADTITGDRQRLSYIYEDVLPSRKSDPSYTTLGERLDDYHYIRSSIFNNSDGNDIDLYGMSSNSLDSYIKIDVLNINPYNSFKRSGASSNPFKGLPKNFLIYNSGYPIRHNENTGKVDVANESTSINVRLYKMLEGSWLANRIHDDKESNKDKFFSYDEWREVAFYEYIRENILKKKVSPNFVNMYGYFISENSMINYDEINYDDTLITEAMKKKDEQNKMNQINGVSNSQYIVHQQQDLDANKAVDQYGNKVAATYVDPTYMQGTQLSYSPNGIQFSQGLTNYGVLVENQRLADQYNNTIKQKIELEKNNKNNKVVTMDANRTIIEANPKAYLGKSLVILTESPTYSIFGWASDVRVQNGNIIEQVRRGIHSINEWKSVLFQLMASLYVMQIHMIYIENFDIERNVYIKDLVYRGGNVTEHWRYRINGVDYYVPNLNYLVLIDSDFADIGDLNDNTFSQKIIRHKLNGDVFNDSNNKQIDKNFINSKVFDMFTKSFDPNNFGRYTQNYGVIQPPNEIKDLLKRISDEASKDKIKNIEYYILKYMDGFIHNRVGTYLKNAEVTNKRENDTKEFKKGDILVHKIDNDTYNFVLYIGVENGKASIKTKENHDDKDYLTKDVNVNELMHYIKTEPILQNYKPNEQNLSDDGLLETYIIN
jgi:hypothetical protein